MSVTSVLGILNSKPEQLLNILDLQGNLKTEAFLKPYHRVLRNSLAGL